MTGSSQTGARGTLRVVVWNIRAGGGRRVPDIADQLARWRVDVAVFSEFRATQPSCALASSLAAAGLVHQRTTASAHLPARNGLFIASRWPVRRVRFASEPREPGRWLAARVAAPEPFTVAALHAPNYVTGRKYAYFRSVLALAQRWRPGAAIIAGDTNSTLRALDEQNPNNSFPEEHFLSDFESLGWHDAFRHLHGLRRVYSWYSPNGGNGYRLDQIFANRDMLDRVVAIRYCWGRRRGLREVRAALSDHQAMLLDVEVRATGPIRNGGAAT